MDIVAHSEQNAFLMAFERNGTLKWQSAQFAYPLPINLIASPPAIADINQDGKPEVILGNAVFDNTGKLLWQGTAGIGNDGEYLLGNPVDVLPSVPGLELSAGNTLYDALGNIIWYRSDLLDGLTAVGDVDGDSLPEIVLALSKINGATNEIRIYVLDAQNGNTKYSYIYQSVARASVPALGDLDKDCRAEILLSGNR